MAGRSTFSGSLATDGRNHGQPVPPPTPRLPPPEAFRRPGPAPLPGRGQVLDQPPHCLSQVPPGQQAGGLHPKQSSEGDSSKGVQGRRWTGGPGWQTGQTHGHSDSGPATRACPWVRAGQDLVRCLRSSQLHPPPLHQGSPEKEGAIYETARVSPLLGTCSLFPPPTSTKTLRDGEENILAPAHESHWLRPCSLLPPELRDPG